MEKGEQEIRQGKTSLSQITQQLNDTNIQGPICDQIREVEGKLNDLTKNLDARSQLLLDTINLCVEQHFEGHFGPMIKDNITVVQDLNTKITNVE